MLKQAIFVPLIDSDGAQIWRRWVDGYVCVRSFSGFFLRPLAGGSALVQNDSLGGNEEFDEMQRSFGRQGD